MGIISFLDSPSISLDISHLHDRRRASSSRRNCTIQPLGQPQKLPCITRRRSNDPTSKFYFNMGLRDLLKKRDRLDDGEAPDAATMARLASPEFTFIRSDTFTQELIHPPGDPAIAYSGDEDSSYLTAGDRGSSTRNRLSFRLSRPRSASASSSKSGQSNPQSPGTPGSNEQRDQPLSPQPKRESAARRLSSRLHLARTPPSSENVPLDLPEIVTPEGNEEADKDGTESQWEKRATMLARENEKHRSRPTTPVRAASVAADFAGMHIGGGGGGGDGEKGGAVTTPQNGVVSSKAIDDDIQEAIRLHEEGELERSTAMFGRLADPNGANNPLSQVLYGLALR